MPTLQVPNASLYYETFGAGPLLLLIPGADGRGSVFHPIAKALSKTYTVICWDRRGFSHSHFTGPQNFNTRLERDADDAAALIQHLSSLNESHPNNASATVFGTSSGAIVAQKLLSRDLARVNLLLTHEPPSFSLLPEEHRGQALGLIDHVYDTYRSQGPIAAMDAFTSGLSESADAAQMCHAMDPSRGDGIRANALFWFEFELRQYPSSEVDMEALTTNRGRCVPLAGIDSGDGPGVVPVAIIAQHVGRQVEKLPGGHVGYQTQPEQFAQRLLEVLLERGS